ncbi:hydroxymethylbilane synthase [Streptomyces chumphonensis]|uniref:Porphobilinogen deaminase n=1 Tax=Streptomyces chumphonensis TaxID=1214925 RepID=A0A927IBV2_9ACTN|nr:hydroxymethylbilane synthase [Streptomyces chumphonensis]MBD3930944.1 hydroxymethylbilane synthase [Streptomyces chumphonensis]
MAPELIRIATRSSPMALAQVERVRRELAKLFPRTATKVVPVTAYGDRWTGNLAVLGGKAAFTREVDATLLEGDADVAVHCVKDVPGDLPLPEGTVFAAWMRREDPRDALVHPGGLTLDELPSCTRIGTSSVRRAAQLAASHPHLCRVPIRGNVGRRLEKLDEERVDALVLAVCGLDRVGSADRIAQVLPVETMCPPLGAGVLGLQCREGDEPVLSALRALGDPATAREMAAERALLAALRGHCNTPVAGYARAGAEGAVYLHARVFTPDGTTVLRAEETSTADPADLGLSVADALLARGARALIDAIAH